MTIDQIKQLTIFVKYVLPDTRPESGLRRLQYFTHLEKQGEYYFGLSFRKKYSGDLMSSMVKENQLVKLKKSVRLHFDKDLWMDSSGNIIIANGVKPLKDKDSKIVGHMKEFKSAR